jgi:hypothetical protein
MSWANSIPLSKSNSADAGGYYRNLKAESLVGEALSEIFLLIANATPWVAPRDLSLASANAVTTSGRDIHGSSGSKD